MNVKPSYLINISFVFTSTPCKHSNHVEDSSICADSLSLLVFTEAEVYNALIYVDPNKATGIDGIGPKILKYCAMSLFRPYAIYLT